MLSSHMGSCLLSGGLFFFCLRLCLTPKPLAVKSVTHICIGNLTTCHNARPWLLSSAENLVCCPSRPQVKTSRSKAMIYHSLITNRKYWFTALSIQFALDWGMYRVSLKKRSFTRVAPLEAPRLLIGLEISPKCYQIHWSDVPIYPF